MERILNHASSRARRQYSYTFAPTTYMDDLCYTCAWARWSSCSSWCSLLLVAASTAFAADPTAAGESICYKENMDSTKIMAFTHTQTFACHFSKLPDTGLGIWVQIAHCNPDIFHHLQEQDLTPTGHWERDLREESLKEGQGQNHTLCQPIQQSAHYQRRIITKRTGLLYILIYHWTIIGYYQWTCAQSVQINSLQVNCFSQYNLIL